ncbi:MAG: M23 family metallopeptidase [Pseudonocardiaceae bacterium]
MSDEARESRQHTTTEAQGASHFMWPLSKSPNIRDDMNTSYGPRIDADRWDFHDGIDLPAAVRTPVHAVTDGVVHRAGPADTGFGSTHVLLKVCDPTDGQHDLFVVYLHLDSIAEGVIPGAHVHQGDVIATVGQEDATYPHLHLEFRKGAARQDNSVHPLHYLPHIGKANFAHLRLDRCNFYLDNGDKRAARMRFEALDRREGDLQGVDVELKGKEGEGVDPKTFHVDFDDRETIVSDKGDTQAFKNGIAVEGYQKSNLKGEGLTDLHYGVIIKDITPEFKSVKLQVVDVAGGPPEIAEFPLPELESGKNAVSSRAGLEVEEAFPPPDWELSVLPGNICQPDAAAALTGSQGLLCQDLQSAQGTLIRAGLFFDLPVARPVRPMSWRLRASIRPAELLMDRGLVIHPLAFLAGNDLMAAACLRKTGDDEFFAGVLIRGADGLFRERIDVTDKGRISTDDPVELEFEVVRVRTRQTTAVVRLNNRVVARVNGDTTSVEPDAGCVGILHRYSGLQITLHIDQLFLTEEPR